LARRRIPNAVSGAVAVSGVVLQALDRGGIAVLSGLAAGVLIVALLYRPWVAGGIGGGDVKFAAAVAVSVGLGQVIRFALTAVVAGGIVAMIAYFLSKRGAQNEIKANLVLAVLQRELPPVPLHTTGRISLPYAVAIAAGTVVTFLTS
jgi:prepilin peptidase CpaA